MTEDEAGEAIDEAWAAGWLALHPGSALPYDTTQGECVPYVLDNEAFDTDNAANFGALGAWARVTNVPSDRNQGSMGPPGAQRFQQNGYIAVQLFCPPDAGAALLRQLCDDVRTVLERKSFVVGSESVVTFSGKPKPAIADGRWYQTTVVVPYYFWNTE